jgi:glutathione peroxidase
MTTLADFSLPLLDGTPQPLAAYAGKVVLVVNTASKCGLTPQYEGLEALWQRYKDAGLVVLGFPCNQFGEQEPGTAEDIAAFCERNYGVSFPVFDKIEVNGRGEHPLYHWLKSSAPGITGTEAIKWNFTKFLIGRDGSVKARFAPTDEPLSLAQAIEQQLAA